MKRPHKTALRAVLGLALLAALLALAKPQALWATLRAADWRWLLLGLVMAVASNGVSAWRWRLLVRFLHGDVSMRNALRWYFQAIGLNALLPGAVVGGDVFRAVMLRRQGQDTAAATWSVLLDRISGVWMLCGLGSLGAAASAATLAPLFHVPVALYAALAVVLAVLWLGLPWCLPWVLRRLPTLAWTEPLLAACARPDFRRQLGAQVWASAAVQVLSAAALACAAVSFGVHLPWAAWAFAMAPIFLMAAMPVSVGGWGTREAACVAALTPFGVAAPVAIGVGLVYGTYGLVQGAMGALAFGLPRQGEQA